MFSFLSGFKLFETPLGMHLSVLKGKALNIKSGI